MITQVFLYIGQPSTLEMGPVWRKKFTDLPRIETTERFLYDIDAVVVPVSICERYGCPAGSTEHTLGKMYVYDSWEYDNTQRIQPRFWISNAIWNTEPPLKEAVLLRLKALDSVLDVLHQYPANSLEIDCSTFGEWDQYAVVDQIQSIEIIRQHLSNILR